jgi:hypothetical protein
MLSFEILGESPHPNLDIKHCNRGHWFLRRSGVATGLALTAGPFGGIVFPSSSKTLFRIGFAWTIHVIGFISLVLGLLGMALMRTRFPPERNVKLVLDVQGSGMYDSA